MFHYATVWNRAFNFSAIQCNATVGKSLAKELGMHLGMHPLIIIIIIIIIITIYMVQCMTQPYRYKGASQATNSLFLLS